MNEFFIYWKNNCQWCENAKRLIEAHGDRWTGLNIEDHPENLEEFRADFPTAKTVPQIIDVTSGAMVEVGTYNDLVEYYAGTIR
jgi:glutaredoxin